MVILRDPSCGTWKRPFLLVSVIFVEWSTTTISFVEQILPSSISKGKSVGSFLYLFALDLLAWKKFPSVTELLSFGQFYRKMSRIFRPHRVHGAIVSSRLQKPSDREWRKSKMIDNCETRAFFFKICSSRRDWFLSQVGNTFERN